MNQLLFILKTLLEDPQNDDVLRLAQQAVNALDGTHMGMFGGYIYGSIRELAPFLTMGGCTAIARDGTGLVVAEVRWNAKNFEFVITNLYLDDVLAPDVIFKLEFEV